MCVYLYINIKGNESLILIKNAQVHKVKVGFGLGLHIECVNENKGFKGTITSFVMQG